MTEIVKIICKSCGSNFGQFGMHGYNTKEKSGEILYVCKKCPRFQIVKIKSGKANTKCYTCNSELILYDKRCPKCNSEVYESLDLSAMLGIKKI